MTAGSPAHDVKAVPFLDPGAGYRELSAELQSAYEQVMTSGKYVLGPEVEEFERAFARFCGVPAAAGTANGLDALALALTAAGIGPGDEVVVPAQTFIASWLAVTKLGAVPVPVDVEPETMTLDVAATASAIGPHTAALMPVHLYGHPADMESLRRLAQQHHLFLLEDAAQAHGAALNGRRVGSLGDAGAFSFYPGKNLGAFGDGGAVTGSEELCAGVRRLGNYGSAARYEHDDARGINSRLDPLQAAFLKVKLGRLERWNLRRREISERYSAALAGTAGLTLPSVRDGVEHAWHLFVVRHPERDALAAFLSRRGISTLIHYPTPPHLSSAYGSLGYDRGAFPKAEAAAATCLSLPVGPHLSDLDVEAVIEAVLAFGAGSGRGPSA